MRIKIASVGEAVLRSAARPLSNEEIGSARIRDLIAHMRETLSDAPGVGLAAPQVGEPLQLAIIEDKAEYQKIFTAAELSERWREPVPFHVLINPEIELLTAPDVTFFEGCLSLPGFVGMVPRARKVRVKASMRLASQSTSMQEDGMPAFSSTRSITWPEVCISIACGPVVSARWITTPDTGN